MRFSESTTLFPKPWRMKSRANSPELLVVA